LEKSKDAFRTISEVSDLIKLPSHVLRFWESKFKCIKPLKRGGGRRYYRPEDVNLLFGIRHLLYEQGLTIKGSLKVIQDKGVKFVTELGLENRKQKDMNVKTNLCSSKSILILKETKYSLSDKAQEKISLLLSKLELKRKKIQNRVLAINDLI